MKKISVILIGAGDRGTTYTREMKKYPDKYEVVAVADPNPARRQIVKEMFDIPESRCFKGDTEILAQPKMADLAVISTVDSGHYVPAMKAISLGYDLLLEKPVAPTARECAEIALAAEKKGVSVLVCHVLRYAPFYKTVKKILMENTIGEVMSAILVEGVGNIHQSHSYIRGNWHKESESAPMLLAKSCHDLDIVQWLLDKPCKKVTSFGSLTYFTEQNAPKGAPVRCADNTCPIKDTCPYNCRKLYYEDKSLVNARSAITRHNAKGSVPTDDEILESLRTTDYGLCVFHANNDVVDHQVVNMEFEGGTTVQFSMNAFNAGGRYIRLFGTKGELYANARDTSIDVYTFEDKEHHRIPVIKTEESIAGGHGGGDQGIIMELYDYMSGNYEGYCAADISRSVKNHLIGFAAEKARHENTVEDLDAYFASFGLKND